jgi:squalene-associated FAD-dependent desaturase
VIVGGGLAGLATAVQCTILGFNVRLFEKRGYLGGRAFSFVDRETNVEIDNGQHVYLGACTAFRKYLRDIDALNSVYEQDRLNLPVQRDGIMSTLSWSSIPGAGMLPSLLRYKHLSFPDKLRVIWGMLAMRFVNLSKRGDELDQITFRSWLEGHGQTASGIDNLWNLIVLPSLNDDIGDVSAHAGIMLFQTALMGSVDDTKIGYSRVALTQLAGEHARKYLESHGQSIEIESGVVGLTTIDGRVTGVTSLSGEEIEADAVVLAVQNTDIKRLVPDEFAAESFVADAESLGTTPIVGIHIWYDHQIMEAPFQAVLNSPLQFVFNVSEMQAGEEDIGGIQGQHIVISLSGAWEWAKLERAQLQERFVAEMAKAFPAACEAEVIRFVSVKQVNATFRVTPGSIVHRASQRTNIPNLYLAGDWTHTDWPSTMESAVRSGNLAAAAIAEQFQDELITS